MTTKDYGDWEYETSLDGYGPATKAAWRNESIDGTVKVAVSEGMHIMKCERGDWLVTVNIGSGGEDEHWCVSTKDDAFEKVDEILPWTES